MKHLTEEEWIAYYYGEGNDRQAMQEHIAECAECAAAGRELAADLAPMQPSEEEARRDAGYGEEVWGALQGSLTPYARVEASRRFWPVRWNLGFASAAVALAAIAGAAFYSGRMWEQKRTPLIAAANPGQAGQRIILFVVSEHLDRSQRLLSELNDPDQAAADHGLQARARELLTENRLYRQSSMRLNDGSAKSTAEETDSSLETILNDLEPVLIELANQPDDLDRAKIVQLRKELNTSGLLFEIHVLRSKARQHEPNNSAPREGTV
jgi:hypothetical protein